MTDDTWQVWRQPETIDLNDRSAVAALLAKLMRDFIAYQDVSPALVGRIEYLLDVFHGTEWHDELEVPLESYEPWGGDDPEHLYTAQQLARLFEWALPFVEREAIHGSPAD